jgi:beta-lactamase regulating signal transducer with metallopeptidase domain/protocatechuate 3,4-dioxygenase beta subunit
MPQLMVEYANSAGDRWAAWVVAASLDAAVLLAMAGLVWLAIRRRVAPQVGYGLFLLVPLKLLLPVVVTVPASVARWTPSGLVSSWLDRARAPEGVESRPPVETPTVAIATGPSLRPVSLSGPPSRSQPVVAVPRPPTSPTARRPDGPISTAAGASAQPVAEAPALSMSAGLLIAWLVGVLLLLGRFIGTQLRFRARLRRIPPVDESELAIAVRELCRIAKVPETIGIVEDDSVAVPAVWGIVRPTIILPRGIASVLTAEQRRWVLLHELAHVRRRDLVILMLQRIAAILHFFNPVIWIANRIIDQLREYACDDLASSLSRASAVESGEAFVRILEHAGRGRRGLAGAVGVFGLGARASCILRVRRLLDTERPVRSAPAGWSLCGLMLLAALSVPHLRAAGELNPAGAQAPAREVPPKAGQEFELRVVGPDGKPIPAAEVEVWGDPLPTAEQIRTGKLIRQQLHGIVVVTDAAGRIVVELPRVPERFNVSITIPGCGPYWAGWSSDSYAQPIPHRFTAELDAAWSIGGIVVDADGKPVAGAEVRPSIEFKKPPGDTRQFGSGARARTDAAGRWHFDSVPVSMADVHVQIIHPSSMPFRRELARREFGIEPGREPAARIVLDRGLTVIGKVTDESGKPITGALLRTKFWNDVREARTGPDGIYRLIGCEPRPVRIVASASGRATDMKELNIEPGMGPVDFAMKPGGTVRVRVLDEQGNPIPRARIFFQQWRGRYQYFEFGHVNQYADDQGVWVWHEAPVDEFQADICPPEGMQLSRQPLIARAEEYVFRVPGPLVVSGKVIDAATREPIKAFRVIPGRRYDRRQMTWDRQDSFVAADGHYEIRRTRGEFAHLIRIEADGYQAAVSRDIKSDEGTIAIDFELKRGKDIVAKVVTPGNVPATGAKVALGGVGSQIQVLNGEFSENGTFCPRAETDESGRFHFPAQDKDFQLVITHPAGFAHIKATPEWTARIIRLEPWSRVEGTFRVGKTTVANVSIEMDVHRLDHSFGPGGPNIFSQHRATTGPDGRFVFERVIPGTGWIGRRIVFMVDEGATEVTSSHMMCADFPAGKTVHIDLGGTGRPVVGRLQPPEGFTGKIRWNFADIRVMPEAAEERAVRPYFMATVDRDGRFRIDDVPAGRYSMNVWFMRTAQQSDDAGQLSNHRFVVPSLASDGAERPIDLGVLRLEKR